jgi:hypothetical protein
MTSDFHVVAGHGVVVGLSELYKRTQFDKDGVAYPPAWKFDPLTGESLYIPVKGYDPKTHSFYEYKVFYSIDTIYRGVAYIFFNYLELSKTITSNGQDAFPGHESDEYELLSNINPTFPDASYKFILAKVKPPTEES